MDIVYSATYSIYYHTQAQLLFRHRCSHVCTFMVKEEAVRVVVSASLVMTSRLLPVNFVSLP